MLINSKGKTTTIFTIGYGNRKIDDFIALITKYNIAFLIDIRTAPYSKYNSDFSANNLKIFLRNSNIKYVFMGDLLGGRPDDPDTYTDGKVDYFKLREKDYYKRGILRLKKAWEQDIQVALLCSESKPEDCHRSKLIGDTLVENNINVIHIDENGEPRTQKNIINRLTKGQLNLFGPPPSIVSSRKTLQRSDINS